MPTLIDIATHLDELLRIREIPDYPSALNGVQVESEGEIAGIAAAVDARTRTITGAIDAGAQLLLVHHGLFWGGLQPLRGAHRRRLALLLEQGMSLYAAHLPLDAHPELGNNVLLARELGLVPAGTFARFQTIDIGVRGEAEMETAELVERADQFARRYGGTARHTSFLPGRRTRRWAICSGAGADAATIAESVARGIDTLIVGEGPHWTAVDADEVGVVVIYAGHYATETLGVQALAAHLSARFNIPWTFIDVPTGL
ncbi:MAG TPA: Nif3-like dinuclear metal center hexameric protein [Gemmatimonadaceae bacterium]|nr:Nif3-like dinuclear metal center hexameric protein [Gemmatimonadaceae bacterium]